jgi:hypothetical protein
MVHHARRRRDRPATPHDHRALAAAIHRPVIFCEPPIYGRGPVPKRSSRRSARQRKLGDDAPVVACDVAARSVAEA